MIIRRKFNQSSNCYNLHIQISSDFPIINLGDERYTISVSALFLGLCIGAVATSYIGKSRIRNLQQHLLSVRNEMISIRNIAQKDVQIAKQYGKTNLLKDFLPTCDNIDRALALSYQSSSNANSSVLYEGLDLTRKELLNVFEKHGVTTINVSVGDVFSHDLCEAMLTTPLVTKTTTNTAYTNTTTTNTSPSSSSSSVYNHVINNNILTDNSASIGSTTATATATATSIPNDDSSISDRGNISDTCDSGNTPISPKGCSISSAGRISMVLLPGYRIHDRILRHAKVGVFV